MKQLLLQWTTLMWLMLLPLPMEAAKRFDEIQLGMTQQEVRALVGKPDLTRMDRSVMQWEYQWQKVPLIGDVYITTVDFVNGRVTACNTFLRPDNTTLMPTPAYPQPYPPQPYIDDVMCDEDFNTLYRYVKGETFDDNRLKLLTVGCLGNCFSCAQCQRMLTLYSFDDDKLKVLRIMAPHIIDRQNALTLVALFSFDSNKAAAARLLGVPWN